MRQKIGRYSINFVPVHGTKNGYDWHRRGMMEEPCLECTNAMRAYWVHERSIKIRDYGRRAKFYGVNHEPYTVSDVLNRYGAICHICLKEIDMKANRRTGANGWEKSLHLDHVMPLSRGGSDTIDNIRPSHGQCNIRKWATILEQK